MKRGFLYIITLFAIAAMAVWMGSCSTSVDDSEPDNIGPCLVFTGLDTDGITDITALIFDAGETLTGIVRGSSDLLDGNTLPLDNHTGGSAVFAAVNITSHYMILPSDPAPGITKASDISFEAIDRISRTENSTTDALCGSAEKVKGRTNVGLKPMTGITVTIHGWNVEEVTPEF
ncbi:MAG: hypothetical protein LUF87_06285 [Alistipes sp.]|nr:hypothetical protein [Alistipes sp.]